ncbi:MAG: hypothetical protein ABSE43_13260 [Steroidobacteraceae bacterium]|jgi:hypothetical protein
MTDEDFLRALESCTLPESEFGHDAHVRASYLYLKKSNFAEALVRLRQSICAYATHLGKSDRYHETMTIAYLALIQQCIVERGDGGGWATFAQSNPELFNRELLGTFYDRDVLESTLARRVFLLPRAKQCNGWLPANTDEPHL